MSAAEDLADGSRRRPGRARVDAARAARVLARHLGPLLSPQQAERGQVELLALPGEAVPITVELSGLLGTAWDALPVHRILVHHRPELEVGAVAALGHRVETASNEDVLRSAGMTAAGFEAACEHARAQVRRRAAARGAPTLTGRVVVLVDDRMLTGAAMRAAAAAVVHHRPAAVLVAVPAATAAACERLRQAPGLAGVLCPRTLPRPEVATTAVEAPGALEEGGAGLLSPGPPRAPVPAPGSRATSRSPR